MKCEDCKFFYKLNVEVGECRKEPPKIVFSEKTEKSGVRWIGGWPYCKMINWCGAFEFKGDTQIQ